jgi:uncharacterized tellurite resistance protein B-like protein
MENNTVNTCKEIFKLSSRLFKDLTDNQRKSLVYRLLNYLRVGNYKRVNNEVLRLINTLGVDNESRKKFIDRWATVYCDENNHEFEKMAYSFLMGLLKGVSLNNIKL